MRVSLARIGILSLAMALSSALPAAAAERFASPGGPESPSAECSAVTPCSVVSAINGAADGDTIHLASGTYGTPIAPIATTLGKNKTGLKITGPSVFDKPLLHLYGSAGDLPLYLQGDALLQDLRIETHNPSYGLHSWPGALGTPAISRVELSTGTGSGIALAASNFYNSVLINRSPNGDGLVTHSSGGGVTTPVSTFEPRGVTIWAHGALAEGITIGSSLGVRRELRVYNSIVHGGRTDVQATADGNNLSRAYVVLENSSFQTIDQAANDSFITPPGTGTNSLADPIFVNLGAGDLRQLPGSPLIDAGSSVNAAGLTDFAGGPRVQGQGVDVGAYESTATTALTGLRVVTNKFRAAPRGASFRTAAMRPKTKRGQKPQGSLVRFSLSAADSVQFRVDRAYDGRRSGRQCGKPSGKNKRGKRCTYFRTLKGTQGWAGVAGPNTLWFTGRWGGKALPAGARGYRLRATPTTSGHPGPPVTQVSKLVKLVRR